MQPVNNTSPLSSSSQAHQRRSVASQEQEPTRQRSYRSIFNILDSSSKGSPKLIDKRDILPACLRKFLWHGMHVLLASSYHFFPSLRSVGGQSRFCLTVSHASLAAKEQLFSSRLSCILRTGVTPPHAVRYPPQESPLSCGETCLHFTQLYCLQCIARNRIGASILKRI